MSRSLTVSHKGQTYEVELSVTARYEDDSFDCHIAGRLDTHACGHWEIDWDETTVESCTDEDGNDVETDDVPGLMDAIVDAADAKGWDFD